MTETEILALIIEELTTPTFEVTEQFLAIHRVALLDGQPLLKSLVTTPNGEQRAYLAVEGERFYLTLYISPAPKQLTGVGTEPYHDIWLRVTSATLSTTALSSLTHLRPARQWSAGDWHGAVRNSRFNGLDFRQSLRPDLFENMLAEFLRYLEQDADGIRALAAEAECVIRVASYFHNGNTMLGGHFLDADTVQRLSQLHLSVDFDLYAKGHYWPEAADE